jgi:hypothetical protein
VNAYDQLARRPRLVVLTLVSLATALLIMHFRHGTADALATPVLANVLAISAGLAIASVILVGLRRRTLVRARRSGHD